MDVPEAGRRYFGLGRNASYDAAKRGELPVIKIGGRLRAVVPAIERMLAEAGKKSPAASPVGVEHARTLSSGDAQVPARAGRPLPRT